MLILFQELPRTPRFLPLLRKPQINLNSQSSLTLNREVDIISTESILTIVLGKMLIDDAHDGGAAPFTFVIVLVGGVGLRVAGEDVEGAGAFVVEGDDAGLGSFVAGDEAEGLLVFEEFEGGAAPRYELLIVF